MYEIRRDFRVISGVSSVPTPANTDDSATTAWVNAVVADGGAVSATQRSRVNTLIVGLKADTLWTIIDRLWLFAGEVDAHQAKIDIVNLQSNTLNGTPAAFDVGGYQGDGLTFYLDSNYTPSTNGVNFTQNSASFVVYSQTDVIENKQVIGSFNAFQENFTIRINSTDHQLFINGGGGSITGSEAGNACWVASRTASNLTTLYRNGSSVGTNTGASGGLDDLSLGIFARNIGGGTFDVKSTGKLSAVAFAAGLSATQAGNLSTRLNTYMTAWGVNVY